MAIRDFREATEWHQLLERVPLIQPPAGIWLGSGPSTGGLTKHTAPWFDDRYEVAVCANKSHYAWHRIARWCERTRWIYLCPEEANVDCDWFWEVPLKFLKLFSFTRTKDVVDKLTSLYGDDPERLEAEEARHIAIRLSHHASGLNPSEYGDGLHAGTPDVTGHLRGTVTMQALHLLGILGCKRIDAYGCELAFTKGEPVHFYDTGYVEEWAVSPGTVYNHWKESAAYIRSLKRDFEQRGIEVRYKCKTLITA